MTTIDENQIEEPRNKKSEFKNLKNAKSNYEYYKSVKAKILKGYKVKEHEDLNEAGYLIFVMFSWKGINNECYSFPLSFHIDCEEFREKLKRFVGTGMPPIQTEMPQESNNWWQS